MDTLLPHYSLNLRGKLLELEKPVVMGILNLTPDSFSDGGEFLNLTDALKQTEKMLKDGARIIDIGGYSSRPGAIHISANEEIIRIKEVVRQILREFPEAFVSIDTFRGKIALEMLELGAHIINDISAGQGINSLPDEKSMFEVLAAFQDVPYIMMHMQGHPQNMQNNPVYEDVVEEVWQFFVERINAAKDAGIKDIIIDPGFGFGKEILHNYQLFGGLEQFSELGLPLLVGVSRKSMLYRLFDTQPKDVLELASILHFKALEMGAHILRAHDVKEAVRTVELFQYFIKNGII
ncbi:MAG: dihydropteroate synthase [Bacteroidia bacterium]|nr:dihydropteroate synthase [Bacteroidia bacterium]